MNVKNAGRLVSAAFALTAILVSNVDAKDTMLQDRIRWEEPSPAVNEAAKKNDKLILADFFADWCGYCHKQDVTSYADDRVILMLDQLVTTRINEKDYPDVKEANKIEGFPTVLIFTPDGEEVARTKGAFRESDGYVKWLGRALYGKALPNMETALKAHPKDIKLLTIMALIHSAADRKDLVPRFLNRAGDVAVAKFAAGEKITADDNGQSARAFRLLSQYFDSHQDYERNTAILYYLAQLSGRPDEVVSTRLALAECFYQTNQTAKAVAEMESLLKVETLDPEQKKLAQTKLNGYKKAPA